MKLTEFLQLPIAEKAKIVNKKYRDEMYDMREGLAKNDPETVEKAKDVNAAYDWFKEYAKGKS